MTTFPTQPLLDATIREFAEKLAAETDRLTAQQFFEAIREAVLSGDFHRYVLVNPQSQAVVYLPYSGVEDLRNENTRLRRKLDAVKEALNDE